MSQETVEQMARFLFQYPSRLHQEFTILWHGGEPTSVPVSFYESAFETLRRLTPPGTAVANRFSTNATLLNEDWCDLIKRWGVHIRVSIDGPEWLHDASRVDRSGRGTFEKAMRGVELLKSNGVPFHVICTLTSRSLDHAAEMWRFYRELGASALHFCVEEILGVNQENSLQSSDYSRIRNFFQTLSQLRNREAPDFYIRELDQLRIYGVPRWRGRPMQQEALPLTIVSIAWDGGVSTFSPELLSAHSERYGDFIFGNVATNSLIDVAKNSKLRMIYSQIKEGVRICEKNCRYFEICGGGCPAPKLFQHGAFNTGETLTCQLRVQAIGDVIADSLNLAEPIRDVAKLETPPILSSNLAR